MKARDQNQLFEEHNGRGVNCEECKAGPGQPCRAKNGKRATRMHSSRVNNSSKVKVPRDWRIGIMAWNFAEAAAYAELESIAPTGWFFVNLDTLLQWRDGVVLVVGAKAAERNDYALLLELARKRGFTIEEKTSTL